MSGVSCRGNNKKEVRDARRQELKRKAEDDTGAKDDNASKIAALESRLEEQMQKIAALKSTSEKLNEKPVKLPPKSSGNPLKPPTGFTQRGSWLGHCEDDDIISNRFSQYLAYRLENQTVSGITSATIDNEHVAATELDSHAD